jgi:hypothetical protein
MEFSEPNNFLAEVDDPRWRLDGSVTELRLKVEQQKFGQRTCLKDDNATWLDAVFSKCLNEIAALAADEIAVSSWEESSMDLT